MKTGYDWRSQAKAAAVADDYAVEKAFMDQAYVAVQNKCGPLMRDPYQIGFEIVYKNESATRMVGIFGFRAGRQLFYVPVFFLNGEIKGSDMLYRHLTKSFVPNTEEWVIYLIATARNEIGTGMPKGESRRIPGRMNLDALAYPPFDGVKRSSADLGVDEEDIKQAADLPGRWDAWLNDIQSVPKVESPDLKHWLGVGGAGAVEKLAALIEESVEFATELERNFPNGTWIPDMPKAAAAPEPVEPDLVLAYSGPADVILKHGFTINDKRQDDKLNVVYAEDTGELETCARPGLWDVLQPDGSMEENYVFMASCAPHVGKPVGGDCGGGLSGRGYHDTEKRRVVLVQPGGERNSAELVAANVHGTQLKSDREILSSLLEGVDTGKAYRVIDPDTHEASPPFAVIAKASSRDGVTEYRVRCDGYTERTIVINPDSDVHSTVDGYFGRRTRFVQVGLERNTRRAEGNYYDIEFKTNISTGDTRTVDSWVRSMLPVKSASIRLDPHINRYALSYHGQTVTGLSKVATAVSLVTDLHIHGDAAMALLDAMGDRGRVNFKVLNKSAAALTLRDQPQFRTYSDPDFGIPVDPAQSYVLETQWNGMTPPDPRIGDAWDPTYGNATRNGDGLGDDALLNMRPQQIAEMSNQGDTSAVFEHGVIGTLTNTFDAKTLVHDYIPKLEDAVDALGRTLFLFYWKPTDFEMDYGADDMSQLENQIGSNFRNLGTLLLELLKRSKKSNPATQGAHPMQ